MELLVWYGDKYACDLAILNKDTTRKMEGKCPVLLQNMTNIFRSVILMITSFLTDGPIQCQKCFMVCSGPVSFANHNKFRCQLNNDHHRWRCIHCDRSFKDQKSLHFHKYIHKGVKPFTCGVCDRVFAFKSSKNRHQKQMHPAVTLDCRCTLCSNVFDDKNRLWQHERTFHAVKRLSNGTFECLKCQKRFTQWVNLLRHRKQTVHSNSKEFICKTCGKAFKKEGNLVRHEALHKPLGPCTCSECGKNFLFSHDLRKHVLHNHAKMDPKKAVDGCKSDKDVNITKGSSEKRHARDTFHCHICKTKFLYTFTYSKHMREKHPSFKVARCGICSKICNDKRRLALHMATRHRKLKNSAKLHPNVSENKGKASNGMHQCDICLKEFVSLESLKAHRGHHNRQKVLDNQKSGRRKVLASPLLNENSSPKLGRSATFSCKICNKSFETSTSLRSHSAHHSRSPSQSGDKSFSELLSSSSSEEKPSLRSAASSAFICRICNKSFKSVNALGSHTGHHSRSPSQKSLKSSIVKQRKSRGAFPSTSSSQVRQKNPQPSRDLSGSQFVPGSKESVSSVSPPKQFNCEVCGKGFHSRKILGHHRGHHFRKNNNESSPSNLSSNEIKAVAETNIQKEHERDACIQSFESSNSPSPRKGEHTRMTNVCVCLLCQREFSSKLALVRHKLRSHRIGPYQCKLCGESFRTCMGLSRHVLYKHGSRSTFQSKSNTIGSSKFKCLSCTKHFSTYSGLFKHMRKLHVDFSFCAQSSKSELKATSDTWRCQLCSREYLSVSGLRKHLKNKHPKQKYDPNQGCKPARKDEFKTTTVKGKKQCRSCKVRFCPAQSANRSYCMRCSRKLQRKGEAISSQSRQSPVNSNIQKNVQSIGRKRNINHLSMPSKKRTVRAFHCFYCQEGCSTINSLYKHLMVVHRDDFGSNPTGFRKPLDNQTRNEAQNHTKNQNLQTKTCLWSCQYCSKELQTESGLRRHVKNKHGKKVRVPDQRIKPDKINCYESSDSNVAESTHVCRLCNINYSTNKSLHCISCNEELLSQMSASTEMKERRDRPHRSTTLSTGNAVRAFKCLYCRKGFSTINSFYKHMVIAHQNGFSSKSHTSKKPLCSQISSDSNNNSIQRVSTNFAPWKCEDCGKKFRSATGFTRHVDTKHSRKRTSSRGRVCKLEGNCSFKGTSRQVARVTKTPLLITAPKTVRNAEKGNASLSGRHSTPTAVTVAKKLLRRRKKRSKLTLHHRCGQCGKRFSSKPERRRHVNEMHAKKNESCEGVLSAIPNFGEKSDGRTSTNGSQPKGKDSLHLAFPCEYCPKKFSCRDDRVKHVMLVHNRKDIPSPSKGRQLKLDAPIGSSAKTDKKSFCYQDCVCFKRKAPNAGPDRQQEREKAWRHKRRSDRKLNGFVSNLKDAMSADRSLDSSESFLNVTTGHSLFKIHGGKSSKRRSSTPLSDVHQSNSVANHCSKVLSTLGGISSPYKRGISCDSTTTKRNLLEYGNESHNCDALSSINGLPRPALRNITCLQNGNKVCC